MSSGLLIADNGRYRGTVCPYCYPGTNYGQNEARVNCMDMGFAGVESWTHNDYELYEMRSMYLKTLQYLTCNDTAASYTDCSFILTSSASYEFYVDSYYYSENSAVFITCSTPSCPANSFLHDNTCTQCPANTTSIPDSDYCYCPASYFWSNVSCGCVVCPEEATSMFGARSCECSKGYVWDVLSELCLEYSFTLISEDGTGGVPSGLVVVNIGRARGTLCTSRDDSFYDFATNVVDFICRHMGYSYESSWRQGKDYTDWEIQGDYSAVMSTLICHDESQSLTDCTYLVDPSYLYGCDGDVNLFLICETCPDNTYHLLNPLYNKECRRCPGNSTSKPNSLHCDCPVNSYWSTYYSNCVKCPINSTSTFGSTSCNCPITGFYWDSLTEFCLRYTFKLYVRSYGLLLTSDGQDIGTVCNDHYNNDTARVNCLDMGFRGFKSWWYGEIDQLLNPIEYTYAVDEFTCNNTANSYTDCSYVRNDDCKEYSFIFLSCLSCSEDAYHNKQLDKCVQCPSNLTSEPNIPFCSCPRNHYWNYEHYDCMRCPVDSISDNGSTSCVCLGGQHWDYDYHLCLTWSFYLVDNEGSRGVNEGMLLADNGIERGVVGTCSDSYSVFSANVNCLDAGFLIDGFAALLPGPQWVIQHEYPMVIFDMKCNDTATSYMNCSYVTGTPPPCKLGPRKGVYISCPTCRINTYYVPNEHLPTGQCIPCPPGSTSPGNSLSCTCGPGLFWCSSSKMCVACPVNFYSDGNVLNCTKCPHFKVATVGSSVCISCPIGHYWRNYTCLKCEIGLYGDGERCIECPRGFKIQPGKCLDDPKEIFNISNRIKIKDTVITVLIITIVAILSVCFLIFIKKVVSCRRNVGTHPSHTAALIEEIEIDES